MWGVRAQVSLLLANGHLNAWRYPLGMILDEARLVTERINREAALQARLTQAAVSAAPNGLIGADGMKKLNAAFEEILGLLEE